MSCGFRVSTSLCILVNWYRMACKCKAYAVIAS